MKRQRRDGFSLFQLLVVIALLVILLGVAFPAIVTARVAAKRISSQNNLKQIALAAANYEAANQHLPAGVDSNHFCAAAYLLPYIEQDNLSQLIDFKKPIDDKKNAEVAKSVIPVFVSPVDGQQVVKDKLGPTNYLFSAGTKPMLADNDGIFYLNSKTRFADITDGTSNTVAVGETLKGDGGTKAVDVHRQYIKLGEKLAEKGVSDNEVDQLWKDSKDIAGDRCASWMDGRFLQGTFTATRALNDPKPDVSFGGLGGTSALRTYDKTVNVAFCDGSVRSITLSKITMDMWKALVTRSGGEVINFNF